VTRSRARPWRRGLAALLSAALALAALELLGRALIPPPEPKPGFVSDPELGWALPVSAEYRWRDLPVRTNSLGLRGPEPGPPTGEDVLTAGDSSVFGDGVGQDETFSARLAALLGPGAQVQNAGVPGYTCPQTRALVARVAERYRPDRLVIYNLHSDLRAGRVGDAPYLGPLGGLGIGRLAAAAALWLRAGRPGSDLEPALSRYRDDPARAAMLERRAAYRAAMAEVAAGSGSPCLELAPLFRASGMAPGEALLDEVHPSPAGHALIARALADLLGAR
jgi:lysophospholipase L1-like esterase